MNFDFGTVSSGSNISFEAVEFADRFLDRETSIDGTSFSLTGATVDGTVASLGDIGLSYVGGAGEAGELIIATQGAAALQSLAASDSATVIASYQIDTGVAIETGTIEFDVEASTPPAGTPIYGDIAIDLQEFSSAAITLEATATAVDGNGERSITLATNEDLQVILTKLFGKGGQSGSIDTGEFGGNQSVGAIATAFDDSTAIARVTFATSDDACVFAQNDRTTTATATATEGSTATADVTFENALSESGRTDGFRSSAGVADAVAGDASNATATVVTSSIGDAVAIAEDGSTATATASEEGSATASATVNSKATATASTFSTTVANSHNASEATATATLSSISTAESENASTASVGADNASAASAVAAEDSDAGSLARNGSAASATATDRSSATTKADNASVAAATSDQNSVSVATSDGESSVTAVSRENSTANSSGLDTAISNTLAVGGSGATANASNTSSAASYAMLSSTAEANADDNSSASAAAQLSSNAATTAIKGSTAESAAFEQSRATSTARDDSVTLAAAIENGQSGASADKGAAAWAVASQEGEALANVVSNTLAQEVAGSRTTTPNLSLAEITSDAEMIEASSADAAASAASEFTNGAPFALSGNSSIEGLIRGLSTTTPQLALTVDDGNDTLVGQANDDSVLETSGAASQNGENGNSLTRAVVGLGAMQGSVGDDTLAGHANAGTQPLGAESDNSLLSLTGGDGNDTLAGCVTDDTILGNAGHDSLSGKAGNDLIQGNVGEDALHGDAGRDTLLGGIGNDTLEGGADADTLTLGAGADLVQDTLSNLLGDTITDFSSEDSIVISGSQIARNAITFNSDSGVLSFDTNGDGTPDGSITQQGDFSGGDFMAVVFKSSTSVTFETFLPTLRDQQAVNPDLVNGIINQSFLVGNGTAEFKVTLQDLGFAGFNNVVGVYEIDAGGNIVDTRLLFENSNADKTSQTLITDVEKSHQLGFFIVQDAANWASSLAAGDSLSFVDGTGAAAKITDGPDVSIAVNGVAVDEMVFHSYAQGLNSDGVQHVLSGVDAGGEAISIGFEDLTGGGDRDYEDVVFRVEIVDDLG